MSSKRIKYIFIPLLSIILSFQIQAQRDPEHDLDKIRQYIPDNLDSALILSKGLLKYENIKSDSLIAISHYFQGIIYYYKGYYYIGSEHYKKALNTDFAAQKPRFKGKIHNNLGVNYDMTDQYELALEQYKKSLKIDQEFNDLKGVAQSDLNIGLLYFNLNQYDEGLTYINKALEFFKEEKYHQGMGLCYHNIGLLYLERKNYNKALDYLLKANSEYLASGDPYERTVTLNNLVKCASEMGYMNDARQFLAESKKLAKENDFEYLLDINLLSEAELNIFDGNYTKAHNILRDIQPTNNKTTQKKSRLQFHINLMLNDSINTSDIIKEYTSLNDSIENYKTNQLIREIQNQFNIEINEISTKLNKEKQTMQNQKFILIGISSLFMIILVSQFIYIRKIKQKKE